MGETRVNLKRLLEDIRDSYPLPLAEVILTELVANSLDSGASSIIFLTNTIERTLTVMDNGRGMRGSELSTYHDIAATTKMRGKGIGFAGLGAKLALLVAQSVTTETQMGRKRHATAWSLSGAMRAPWKVITPPGCLKEQSGTAVRISLPPGKSQGEDLLHSDFIRNVLLTHFSPLFDEEILKRLGRLYIHRISFSIDDRVVLPDPLPVANRRFFYVHLTKTKRPVGVGFLVVSDQEFPEQQRGIAISTYGKVIKRGWEWIGTTPVRPSRISGILELPALAQILTINKADFLKDQTSLKIYYRYRKAIQSAIEPILTEFGEQPIVPQTSSRDILGQTDRLTLQDVLTEMVTEFPELEPLVGVRRSADGNTSFSETPEILTPIPLFDLPVKDSEPLEATPPEPSQEQSDTASEQLALALPKDDSFQENIGLEDPSNKRLSRKTPSLSVRFEEDPTRDAIGWIADEIIWINKGHPAYKKATDMGHERYHTVVAVGLVLASYVSMINPVAKGEGNTVEGFLTRYLAFWGGR